MTPRWYRLLPLIFAALWLPFQAVAAMAMTLGAPVAAQAMAANVDDACPMHHDAPSSDPASGSMPAGCAHCLACGTAGPLLPPVVLVPAAVMQHDVVYAAWQPTPPTDFILTPPHHPPKLSA